MNETENWTHPLLRLQNHRYGREDSTFNLAKKDGRSIAFVCKNMLPAPIPEFDGAGYPTNETLNTISQWPIKSNFSVKDLINYVENAWVGSFKFKVGYSNKKKWIKIKDEGDSVSNGFLIEALIRNVEFWDNCWLESQKGGIFKFLITPFEETKEKKAHVPVEETTEVSSEMTVDVDPQDPIYVISEESAPVE